MRFYGLGYQEILDLPVVSFWFFHAEIDRLRAEEILDWLPAHGAAMGGEHVGRFADNLRSRVGQPIIFEQMEMAEEDKKKARRLFGQGK